MAMSSNPDPRRDPGLSRVRLPDGSQWPVLDITHPLFISSIDEAKLARMLADIEKKGQKRAKRFQKMPALIRSFLIKRSLIMAELLSAAPDTRSLSGWGTLLMKMGPGLIGRERKRFLDRLASRSAGAVMIRMRLRDICRFQAETLAPLLRGSPGRGLCFINIAGGTSLDSINSLFLIQQEDPVLLKDRRIEINVLERDAAGPDFAALCIEALKSPGGRFRDLDVSLRHIPYDWNEPEVLERLLLERRDRYQICASEGGLFEYGSDEAIIRNLNALYTLSEADTTIAGSVMRDAQDVDAGALAAMTLTRIRARLLGIGQLKSLFERTRWRLDRTYRGNPRYEVFLLRKELTSSSG